MFSPLAIAMFVVVFLVLFLFRTLQWFSNRTYKPSKEDIAAILRSSMEGTLSRAALDEFMNVKIAYDRRLDGIREKFSDIVAKKQDVGQSRRQIESLLTELEQL